MNIAVTGASGFLGRHVTAELIRRGYAPVLATRNPASLAEFDVGATVVPFDLHDPPADPFAALGHPDILIHLAWQGLPNYRSTHHLESELPAQSRFLASMLDAGLSTLSVAGTCLEYGTVNGSKSETTPGIPSTAYATAKDNLRRQLIQHTQSFNLVWHRLFYLYGPGQSPLSLLPQLERAVAQGESVFRMSGGQQIRDFHPVSPAASEIVSLALKQRSFGIVNGCSGQPVTVQAFVERYLASCNLSIKLELGFYPYTDYEPFEFWGDTSYLNHCLAS